MFYDYLCDKCGHHEERNVTLDTRDSQTCHEFGISSSVESGATEMAYCNGALKRQPHYSTLAIYPDGISHALHLPVHAQIRNPDAYPGKRARLDAMNGLPNSSEYDEWGTPLGSPEAEGCLRNR